MNTFIAAIRRYYTALSIGLLNTLILLVITVVLLEFVAKFLLDRQQQSSAQNTLTEKSYQVPWKDRYFLDIQNYISTTGGKQVYEPYTLWKNPDFTSPTFNIVQGYRATVNPPHSATDSVITVFAFGGSTMFCAEVPDEFTLASALSRQLHAQYPGKKFVVTNWGIPGFVRDQQVLLLSRLLMQGKRPDLVVFVDGLNDTRLKMGQKRPEPHGFSTLYEQIYRSIKERIWATLVWKSSLLTLVMRSQTEQDKFERDTTVLRTRANTVLQEYIQNMNFTDTLARTYNFQTIYCWQPHLLNTNKMLQPEEQLLQKHTQKFMGPFFDVMQEEVQRGLFQKPEYTGLQIYDLTGAWNDVKEYIFVDAFHVNAKGNEVLAQKVVEKIRTSAMPLQ